MTSLSSRSHPVVVKVTRRLGECRCHVRLLTTITIQPQHPWSNRQQQDGDSSSSCNEESIVLSHHASLPTEKPSSPSGVCCAVVRCELNNHQELLHQQSNHNSNNNRRRCFTSSSSVGKSPTDPPSRSGPIPIHKTPRGVVAASRRIKSNETSSSSTTSSSSFVINGIHHHPQVVEGHNPIHFIKGGTPCDPAAPPFRLADSGEESLYTLVLLRHGESEWNSLNKYTGWTDVNLTKKGEMEARAAGRLLYENGIELDHAFTSVLKRASFSTNMALNMAKQHWIPVTKSWRLNERHYGALQGYNKDTAWKELGIDQEVVMQMRRSYDTRPPLMQDDHPYWHGNDRRYRKLSPEQLERTRAESLKDTAERVMPFFNSVIVPSLRAGNKCIVVSHANTIRTLVKHIDHISDEDIKGMSIPTGIPLLYRLDKNFQPVDPDYELEFRYMVEPKGYTWATSRQHGFHGVYLGDLERLQDIQRKRDVTNRNWQRIILHNIVKSLIGGSSGSDALVAESTPADSNNNKVFTTSSSSSSSSSTAMATATATAAPKAFETRQLWWQIHERMQTPEYNNMLLLIRMKEYLENCMYQRKQKFMTLAKYESIVNQLHVDAEGHLVEPFVDLADRCAREERQRNWYESLALDLEEECLIK